MPLSTIAERLPKALRGLLLRTDSEKYEPTKHIEQTSALQTCARTDMLVQTSSTALRVSPMTQGSKMHLTVSTEAVDCLLTAYLDWWCDFRAACL